MNPADPLSQLRDIHLPDPVSPWPPGPGWWVLAALLLMALVAAVIWCWRHYRRNAWRRSAQAALAQAHNDWQQSGDHDSYLQAVNAILKRAALARFPREDVAALSCERWEAFLDRHWRKPPEAGFSELGFGVLAYQPGSAPNVDSIHGLCQRWVAQLEGEPC